MKKILPLILVFSLLLSLLTGCVPENRPYEPTGDALAEADADLDATEPTGDGSTQDLTLIYYPDRSLNPFTCADFTNQVVLSLVYQSLFNVGRNGEAVPILCESYEVNANYKTYTFYLDANAKFSDGTRVTLDDVQASFEAAKASNYFGGRFLHVSSFASNGEGFTIQLDTPMEDFLLLMDIPIVKASEVEAESPVGLSAPYVGIRRWQARGQTEKRKRGIKLHLEQAVIFHSGEAGRGFHVYPDIVGTVENQAACGERSADIAQGVFPLHNVAE